MIKLLYFASLRERLGTSGESLDLPRGITTVDLLRDHLAQRGDVWLALTTTRNLRAAVNQTMVGFDAAVADGDEVAFFPPVTGG
jgi:sulfur-carrier protein